MCFVGFNPDEEVVRLDLREGGVLLSKYVDQERSRRPSWVLDLKSLLPSTGRSRAVDLRTGTICGGTEWTEHRQVAHSGRTSDRR